VDSEQQKDLRVVVIITLMDDVKVFRTLHCLHNQILKPSMIFVADGTLDNGLFDKIRLFYPNVVIEKIYGSIVESRYQTIQYLMSNYFFDILVFVDSDQYPECDWLQKLTRPIKDNLVGFTCGCDKPVGVVGTRVERYLWRRRSRITGVDQRFFSMGNSAWSRDVFKCIGNFDKDISSGGEDYDVNIRATNLGFKGVMVDAFVVHDFPEKTLKKWVCKRLKYHKGTTICYLKNGVDIGGIRKSMGFGWHPLDWLDRLLKVFGFISGFYCYKVKKMRT